MDTRVTGPLDWAVVYDFARVADRGEPEAGVRDAFIEWLGLLSSVLPCGKCRESSTAMMELESPLEEVRAGRALEYVYRLRGYVAAKVGESQSLPLRQFLSRSSAWSSFSHAGALFDTLGWKIMNMAQRTDPRPVLHARFVHLSLCLGAVCYGRAVPTVVVPVFKTTAHAFTWFSRAVVGQPDAAKLYARLFAAVVHPGDMTRESLLRKL